jgi:hypothetical protein
MVIIKLDFFNVFGSLCSRLMLHVLSDKVSCDYECSISEDFETTVHDLRSYFELFKFARTCESTFRFYSYVGATQHNYSVFTRVEAHHGKNAGVQVRQKPPF